MSHRDSEYAIPDIGASDAVARLADLIAERLETRPLRRPRWVGADVVAAHLGVDVSYVYEHANLLGARRLGDGPRARLRFRLDLVDEALLPKEPPLARQHGGPRRAKPARRRARTNKPAPVPLLPIRRRDSE